MKNLKDLCICELKTCQLVLEKPIMLPCGSTICKEHVLNCEDKYNCSLCDIEHVIPENGFPINKFAEKTIKECFYLNELQRESKDSFEKLEKKIEEHESLNSENIIYEYFSSLRNKVDLHREQLIEQINKKSEEIIKQLKELEEKCKLNAAKLEKMNLDQLKIKDMKQYKLQLRQPDLKDYDLIKLYSDINDMIEDIQDDINNFNNESLINQNIQFKKENSNHFGELKIENIQKPIKTEANKGESTLKFVINDFSKFKESGQGLESEDKCILRGLEWKIWAESNKLDDGTFELGFYLRCDDNNQNQSKKFPIWVKDTSKLLNLNNPDKNIIETSKKLYEKSTGWGSNSFISMKELSDPENGFYDAEKDCVTLEQDFHVCRCLSK